jgi:hypothetical protein
MTFDDETFDDELTYTEWQPLLWDCVARAELSDRDGRMRLLRDERGICVVEPPGRWRARERRGLHRLGFRPRALSRLTLWRWALSREELRAAAESHPLLTGEGPRTPVLERLALAFSREPLMREQLQRVLSDVFRFEPGDLWLHLPEEEDEDWDEDDEDAQAS